MRPHRPKHRDSGGLVMSKLNKRSAIAVFVAAVVASGGFSSTAAAANDNNQGDRKDLSQIDTIVVIYAENRSFDNLFGMYPGANGLSKATGASMTQLDRDGSV